MRDSSGSLTRSERPSSKAPWRSEQPRSMRCETGRGARARRRLCANLGAFQGLGSGVFEIALPFKGDAFRVVYAVQLAEEIWVLHTFQKKSTKGVKTPQHEVDLIRDRLKRLKEMLK
jgi:hypothetical protein